MAKVTFERIYGISKEKDGIRILADRLWPRGISKEQANLDYWLKELGPSTNLRKWFQHDKTKFAEFKQAYLKELAFEKQYAALQELKHIIHHSEEKIVILFAAKEKKYNHTQILKELI